VNPYLTSITVAEGEDVEVGALLGEISASGAASATPAASAPAKKPEEKKQEVAPSKASDEASEDHKLSPAVTKMVNDNNLDATKIPASGKDGRLTKEDVMNFMNDNNKAKESAAPAPSAPAPVPSSSPVENSAREERVRMSKLRQVIAKRLKGAQESAAILTTFNEVDMGAIMALRKEYQENFIKKHDVKLGFMSFFVKAAVQALKEN